MDIEEFAGRFSEEPGYLAFADVGPVGRAVKDEQYGLTGLLGRARFGTLDALKDEQHSRALDAISVVSGFTTEQICFQPDTGEGLRQVLFGVAGSVALSPFDHARNTFAAARSTEFLGMPTPQWLDTDDGRITPGNLRDQLTADTAAVVVSLVDHRSGYLADLEGIRHVSGDRLLIVDASHGFGIVDAPLQLADVVIAGGQRWVRAGWGTGFIALSATALDRITPVTDPDPIAEGRLAAALEEIAQVGVLDISENVLEKTRQLIDLADEFGIPVLSPRAEHERAGIVVVEPAVDQLTVLEASLFNHGVSATRRGSRVCFSAHVSTSEETFAMVRASFTSFASAITV